MLVFIAREPWALKGIWQNWVLVLAAGLGLTVPNQQGGPPDCPLMVTAQGSWGPILTAPWCLYKLRSDTQLHTERKILTTGAWQSQTPGSWEEKSGSVCFGRSRVAPGEVCWVLKVWGQIWAWRARG